MHFACSELHQTHAVLQRLRGDIDGRPVVRYNTSTTCIIIKAKFIIFALGSPFLLKSISVPARSLSLPCGCIERLKLTACRARSGNVPACRPLIGSAPSAVH